MLETLTKISNADGDLALVGGEPQRLPPIYNSLGKIPLVYRVTTRPSIPASTASRTAPSAPGDRYVCPIRLGPGADFHTDIEDPTFSDVAGGDPKPDDGRWKQINMPAVVVALVLAILILGCCLLAAICVIRSSSQPAASATITSH